MAGRADLMITCGLAEMVAGQGCVSALITKYTSTWAHQMGWDV